MARLTKYVINTYELNTSADDYETAKEMSKGINDYKYNIVQKLGELEDVEEKLEIDLLTLFGVVEIGSAWTLYDGILDKCDSVEYMFGECFIYFYWNNGKHLVFRLKDYGKTWALMKEELENGK